MSQSSIGKQTVLCCSMLLAILASCPFGWAQDPFGGGDDPFGNAGGGDPFGNAGGDPFGGNMDATPPDGDVFGGDSFGGPAFGGAAPAAATPTGSADVSRDDPDPVVRLIRLSPPQTVQQWADALTWMVRIQRWDEARRLLEELRQANWSIEQQAELARAGGTRLWMRLRVDEAGLTPEQQQLVRTIYGAPGKLARDPGAIEGWIAALASPDADQRKRAQLKLQDGGLESASRLVNHLLLGDTTVPPGLLAQTLSEFGADGHDALKAACLVRNPAGVARVYEGLAELEFKPFAAELASGVAGRVLNESAQAKLIERLSQRLNSVPDAASVASFLAKRFENAVEDYQQRRTGNSQFGVWIWRPSEDGRTVQYTQGSQRDQSLERAAQLAAHRMLLNVGTPADLVGSGTVLLQRAYQLNPNLALGNISQNLLASFDQKLATNPGYWQQVFATADEWQMHGAALRSLQLMTEHAVQGDFVPPLDFISKLLRDPRPIIRYTALSSIARLDPKQKFGGAELAVETAVEMVGVGSGPQALVIANSTDLRFAAANMVALLTGQQPISVGTGRAALKALNQNDPIEMIIISDRVSDLSLFELMQRVRNSRQGRSLPIAVLANDLYQHELRLIESTPGVVSAPLTKDTEQAQRVLTQLWSKLDTNPLSSEERSQLAATAGRFLAKIAEQPEAYSFYPLQDWSDRLLGQTAGLSPAGQVNVLSAIGTDASQQRLIELAARTTLSAEERLQAAQALGTSLKRFGTLLSRQEIEQAYELYNQLGPQDTSLASSLGLVLDYIEAQAGKIPWPESK